MLLNHVKHVDRFEFLEIVDKDVCPGYPLSVEFPPDGLSPAGVGESQVKALLIKIVPIGGRYDVSKWIREVMGHHLGFAGSARREIK